LKEFYNEKGFTLDTKVTRFIKNGFDVFLGGGAIRSDNILIYPSFSVENLEIKKVLKTIFPEDLTHLVTYQMQGSELASLFDIPYSFSYFYATQEGIKMSMPYYKVGEGYDLEPIISDHIDFMEKIGFPFFDKLSSLEGINLFFNQKVLEGSFESFCTESRQKELKYLLGIREALSALVVAYLLKDKNIEELIKRLRFRYSHEVPLNSINKVVNYFSEVGCNRGL